MNDPERIPKMHPLENPVAWLVLQVAELALVTVVLRLVLPDGWSSGLRFGILVAVIVTVFLANLWIRRRFIPH